MVQSIQKASSKVTAPEDNCFMCKSTTANDPNIYNACIKQLRQIFDHKHDLIDSGLARAILIGRKHERDISVRSLVTTLQKPNKALAAKVETLKKVNKVMRQNIS